MPKKVLIALPPSMLEQVDYIAQCEHRTRSDLIRESLRRYLDNFKQKNTMPRDINRGGSHGGPVTTRPLENETPAQPEDDFDEFNLGAV